MIIYNKTWLTNLLLIDLVEKEYEADRVSGNEFNNIKAKYPVGFYTPNFFIRVGLFILTFIISQSISGFTVLLLGGSGGYVWLACLGILNYLALQTTVKNKFHYRSGVDDALLWITFIYLAAAYYDLTNAARFDSNLAFATFIFILSLYLTVRFSDLLMSLVAYLSCLGILFFAWQNIGPWGIATMPFTLMLFSALMYWLIRRSLKYSFTMFYANCMVVLQAISLITLYAAGNYFVVKELGDMLNKTSSESIPFGGLFWTWTLIVPLAYIYWGMLKRDTILIRSGLLLCIAAALTFRNYYHVMPLELALILSGTAVLFISWFLTKYLKDPKHGITYQDLSNDSLMDQLKIESLLISETSSGIGGAPSNTGTQMGGGKFGGGGASGGF
ncbi:hypothetical protein [Daejeonella lutea]|uniref:Uncharacterized protein n=1 Tax=Daejeonella lutea TaxID=572036 RepID=A0A1T5F868_9SPHI|nr:hypothetical protein [Daejeonella lutea]SKB92373.1 hypothetical protein SAMN05661099_3513 [Daejeonella lutea]